MFEPDYPMHAALFPTKDQVDIFKEQYLPQADTPVDGSGGFRPTAFAQLQQNSQRPADKDAKDAIKFTKQACADFLFCFLPLWSQKDTTDADLTSLARLAKAASTPELTGLHMVTGNISPKELDAKGLVALGAGTAKYNQLAKILRADRSGFSVAAEGKTMPIYCSKTGKVLGRASMDAKGGIQITDKPASITPEAWEKLWGSAKAKIMVVPKSSLYKAKFYDAVKSTAATAGKVLPPMIAVLEAMNFGRASMSLIEQELNNDGRDLKTSVYPLIAGFGLAYYTLDAVKAIIGEKQLIKVIGAPGKFIFEETISIFGGEVAIFKAWSASTSGLTSLVSFYDMVKGISNEDYDAAIFYGFAGTAYLALALAKIGAAQVIAAETAGVALAEAGSLAFLGPWGWCFLAMAIGASVTAALLADTEIEKWAKFGPFALETTNRWTMGYEHRSPEKAYSALLGVTMQPQITIRRGGLTSDNAKPDIVIECTIPGYNPNNGRFLLDVTAQNRANQNLYGDGPMGAEEPANFRSSPPHNQNNSRLHHGTQPTNQGPMGAEGPDSYHHQEPEQLPQNFHRMELIEKDGVTMGLRYYFRDISPQDNSFYWRARARYVFKRGELTVSLPFADDTIPLPAGNRIYKKSPGFVYSELNPIWS